MTGSESSEPEDRLSELPDSLIFEIFGFLPTVDVVRTTVLSTRWKNLWTTIPYLTFNDSMMGGTDKARKFINGALKLWRGIKLLKFSVHLCEKLEMSMVLGTMKRRYLPLLLPNVTCLEVCGCFLELKQMVRLLEMLPKLKMLVLVTEEGASYPNLPDNRLKSRKRFLKSFLRQLRSVEVRWTRGDTSFYALMELLLRQASQLQQVVFRKKMDVELEVSSYFYIRGIAGEKTEILNYMKS